MWRLALAISVMVVAQPPLLAQHIDSTVVAAMVEVGRSQDGSTFRALPVDSAMARALRPVFDSARQAVASFFGAPFPEPVALTLVPDRVTFTSVLRAEWGVPETACWMVGTGVADFLVMLSPRAWPTEACEHDAADDQHVRDIMTHELVHVYHGQHHESRDFDFDGAEDLGWLLEGLAVHVAGQLERGRLAEAREAIQQRVAPTRLEDGWTGRYRYGVSGSLVAFIDRRYGRAMLRRLLPLSTEQDVLSLLGLTEQELLRAWQTWVRESLDPV